MNASDWRTQRFRAGVLAEPQSDDGRLVLWLPLERVRGVRYWERIGTPAQPVITRARGVCATEAVAMRARRRAGLLGMVARLFRPVSPEMSWLMPNGTVVERTGERRADLALAWSESAEGSLDEARIRQRWPQCAAVRPIADNLFLVEGVDPRSAEPERSSAPAEGSPLTRAEKALAEARDLKDRHAEIVALLDLGILTGQEGDPKRAVALLDEALALAKRLNDPRLIGDVTSQLGLAALHAGEPWRALELLEEARGIADEGGDEVSEKMVLEWLATAYGAIGNSNAALSCLERALAIARRLGDQSHEASLLWMVALQFAVNQQRDHAAAAAQRSIDLLVALRKPQAAVYSEHLQRYLASTQVVAPGVLLGGSIDTTSSLAAANAVPAAEAPGLFQMALNAARAMTRFAGSGFKTTPAELLNERLRQCASCDYFSGLRCRACGCFLDAKARMLHESCPIGRWPATAPSTAPPQAPANAAPGENADGR